MPLVVELDVIRTKAFCGMNDQLGINIMHWIVTQVTGVPTLEELANAMTASMQTWYANYLPDAALMYGVTVARTGPLGTITGDFLPSLSAVPGSVAGGVLPLQVSGLLTIRTGRAGRSFRGRIYPPFMSATYQDAAGNMNATGLGAMTVFAANWTFPVGNTFTTPSGDVIARLGVADSDALIIERATVLLARPRFATQRRRGQTGRPNVLPPF